MPHQNTQWDTSVCQDSACSTVPRSETTVQQMFGLGNHLDGTEVEENESTAAKPATEGAPHRPSLSLQPAAAAVQVVENGPKCSSSAPLP